MEHCGGSVCSHSLPTIITSSVCTEHVTTPAGALSTTGSSTVDITGANLGVEASAVSIAYSGGSPGLARRTYKPPNGTCVIVAAGTHIRCATVPGVGTNYTFTVTVDGASSASSADTLDYEAPSVGRVYGPGAERAPAVGGATIFLRGTGFGPLDGNTSLVVWAVPAADDALAFPAKDCVVVEAHATIRCNMSAAMGASLSWRVTVEGQNNTQPASSVAAPVVTRVALGAGATVAATTGGTLLIAEGSNFGDRTDRTTVSVTTPGGVSDATSCVLMVVDTTLQCALPAGVGAISRVTVTVLGQSGYVDTGGGLAYGRPTVTSVPPAVWPTDVTSFTVTVTGTGFGSPASSRLVSAAATALGSPCANTPVVAALNGTSIAVISDSVLSFVILAPAPHVAPQWAVSVVVAGQGLDNTSASAAIVATQAPSVPVVGLSAPSNGTHQFLSLVGTNYGPVVSRCGHDVTVAVNGAPCAQLAMIRVGVRCGSFVHGRRLPCLADLSWIGCACRPTRTWCARSSASRVVVPLPCRRLLAVQPRGSTSVPCS